MLFWTAYLLLCVIAGLLGRSTRLGFWGVTLAGIVATPIVALVAVLLFGRPRAAL